MQGQLFTQDFLEQGIIETEQWRSIDGKAFAESAERLQNAYKSFTGIKDREDEERFGRYLTKDLILAYMNAVAAGDVETVVSV